MSISRFSIYEWRLARTPYRARVPARMKPAYAFGGGVGGAWEKFRTEALVYSP
jgi:hypothetical protein